VPGYKKARNEIRDKGIDEVLVSSMVPRMLGRAVVPLAKAAHARTMAIAVGSKFPSTSVYAASWPPTGVCVADRIADKKVIVVGLPGAFTPT